jgi:hypothetical protein
VSTKLHSECKTDGHSTVTIPRREWSRFLREFSRRHHGWLVTLETDDLEAAETVTSPQAALEAVEFDLEDEQNPRINVVVKLDNKLIKNVFLRPSRLVLQLTQDLAE